jgi:hypothetical protein
MTEFESISPLLEHPRIHRQVSFDSETFDLLQDAKRLLLELYGRPITNSGTLRVLLLSHPLASQERR